MKILKPYDQLYDVNNHKVLLKSGRDAGKSTAIYQKVVYNLFKYPDMDIIVSRAFASDMKRSIFSGIQKYLIQEGLDKYMTYRSRPLGMTNNLTGNTIWFVAIGGHDLESSKGLEPHNKVSLWVVDECQQLKKQENFDQAYATFRRHFHEKVWQFVVAFNPKKENSHWLNEYYRINEQTGEYKCIYSSYRDIAGMLTDVDLREIRLEKEINYDNYRYLYLGETEGLFGIVKLLCQKIKLLKINYVI